jgi:hypothetical protein
MGAKGAILCQSSESEHSSEILYCGLEGGQENPAVGAAGFWLGNLPVKVTLQAGSTLA